MSKNDNQLNIQRYIILTSVIILLLALMFFVMNMKSYIRREKSTRQVEKHTDLKQASSIDIREKIQTKEDLVIIEGKDLKKKKDLEKLNRAIDEKKIIVFTSIPGEDFIKKYKLSQLLGIEKILGEKTQKEINLVAGFMLGGFYKFTEIEYQALEVQLSFTTKVYGYGEKTSGRDNPIIWRNIYKGREIYLVNGPFMETNASYGIFSAIMAEVDEDYIYPVINSRLMIYENLPYLSYENKKILEKNYNRNAMKLQHDILFPDLLSINKRREFIPNGFLGLGFKENYKGQIDKHDKRQLKSYRDQIFKDGGEVGLKYSGDIEYDSRIYKEIYKDSVLRSILIREEIDDLEEILKTVDSIESVLGPFKKDGSFKYVDEKVVYIPFTKEGIIQNGQEELEFISMVTAFGTIVQNLNLEEIVNSKENREKWTGGSKEYIKLIDQERVKFDFLKNRNITQTANAVKILLNNSPEIKKSSEKIKIKFSQWYGESHYILRTNKKIENITNGSYEKIEEDAYLITIREKEVDINFKK